MQYFNSEDSLLSIVERYPETEPVFTSNGFPQMDDKAKREQFAKSISLKMALTLKQIDFETFSNLLVDAIERDDSEVDASLNSKALSGSEKAIKVIGALPCPVRIPLLEKFNSFTKQLKEELGTEIESELKAASMGLDWVEEHVKEVTDAQKLPDIFISAGFDMFFDKAMFGKFKEQGVFADYSPIQNYNHLFADIDLKDPKQHFSLLGVVPAVFLINTQELGDLPLPTSWADIMKPEFEKKVSLPVGDFDLFNAILLSIYKKYGDDGVEKLGKSLLESLHPSQMVKSAKKRDNRPIVTIMPYFFTKMVKEGGTMKAVWPSDGAIISPIFMLTKADKQAELQPIVDFFASQQVGEILAHSGLFPSVHPNVDNRIAENNKFMWLGWDYIYSHDISATIKHCEQLFQSSI
ncbi:MAG: ABC transporter substrate-binding protein [Candidatus Cloacimonadales bacterium]